MAFIKDWMYYVQYACLVTKRQKKSLRLKLKRSQRVHTSISKCQRNLRETQTSKKTFRKALETSWTHPSNQPEYLINQGETYPYKISSWAPIKHLPSQNSKYYKNMQAGSLDLPYTISRNLGKLFLLQQKHPDLYRNHFLNRCNTHCLAQQTLVISFRCAKSRVIMHVKLIVMEQIKESWKNKNKLSARNG